MAEKTCSEDERRDEQSQATATRDSHSNSNSGQQLSPVILNAIRNAQCLRPVVKSCSSTMARPKQSLSKEEEKKEFMDFVEGRVIIEEEEMKVTTSNFLEVLEEISNIMLFGVKGRALHNIKEEKPTKGSQHHDLDTLVHIDSSSEEEDIILGVGFAKKTCRQQFHSKLQHTVKRVTYPSRTDAEAIDILASDLRRLEPSEFLNDTIIDFYVRYIQREFLSEEDSDRFYFFNSFFYKKLSILAKNKKTDAHQEYRKILNWTRDINIFERDYLIIPVHDKLHWSLAIVCFPKCEPGSPSHCERCILHLDSLTYGHKSYTVFQLLRRYLVAKWKDTYGGVKRGRDDCTRASTQIIIPGKRVPVPLQENSSDCGLFLLHYARKFVQNAPRAMKLSDVEDVFGKHWFPPSEASNLRASIQEQLRRLFRENEEI